MLAVSFVLFLPGFFAYAHAEEQGDEASKAPSKQDSAQRKLTKGEVASLAAKLANEKSKLHFGREPFKPEHHEPVLRDDRWHWGGLDPAGIDGYSAKVSFDILGGNREVEVFFSDDAVRTIKPPPRGTR
jgi:hypothetical protein